MPRLVAIAILVAGPRVFVERRPEEGPLPGMWQFPGGKVEFGEHPWDALCRELKEELRLHLTRGTFFGVYSHVYEIQGERVHYVLLTYRIPVAQTAVSVHEDRRWVTIDELRTLAIVPGSLPIVEDLLREARSRIT